MGTLVKEDRYILRLGAREHVLRVHELVEGPDDWPQRFRVELPVYYPHQPREFYASTVLEALEWAAERLSPAIVALTHRVTLSLERACK